MASARAKGSSWARSAASWGDLHRVGPGAGLHALERRLGRSYTRRTRAPTRTLRTQLHRRQEQVLEEAEVLTVEAVHRGHRRGGVVADVAHQPAHVRPVLLLDVGVVVFFVRPAAGHLDGAAGSIVGGAC